MASPPQTPTHTHIYTQLAEAPGLLRSLVSLMAAALAATAAGPLPPAASGVASAWSPLSSQSSWSPLSSQR